MTKTQHLPLWPFAITAAICAVGIIVFLGWQNIEKTQNEIAEYVARRDAFMRECVLKESANRCLDLFRWTQPQ